MMKRFLFCILAVAFSITGSWGQREMQTSAEIDFEKTEHKFGIIKEGAAAVTEFKFKNTGKEPLVILKVTPTPEVTTEWRKDPVKPGATGVIKVIYNTTGNPGTFSRTITIESISKTKFVILTIRGTVSPINNSGH